MSKQTITEFLEARISEDESREAGRYRHRDDLLPWGCTVTTGGFDPEYVKINHADGESVKIPVAEFRERYTEPAPDIRMLAECAAKRAIIEQADWASSDRSQVISEFCVGQAERDAEYATDPGALILKAIATVYADHAEYDKGWAL